MKKFYRVMAMVCILGLLSGCFAVSTSAQTLGSEQWDILTRTNEQRAQNGLPALSTFSLLEKAAQLRAEEIFGYFSHLRPDGRRFFTVLDELKIQWAYSGENIAAGQKTAAAVAKAWYDSPDHRENILDKNAKHLGIGHIYNDASKYKNYWAQIFVGGCVTEKIALDGAWPKFDEKGRLVSKDALLAVTCDLHGTAYVPLVNTDYSCKKGKDGSMLLTVKYDGQSICVDLTTGFADVAPKDWYYESVKNAVAKGWFNGTSDTSFEPNGTMTRAMLVTVLYRMEGSPAAKGKTAFVDLSAAWYKNAIRWASKNGIVTGVDATHFAPDTPVSREQIAVILYRHTGKKQEVLPKGDYRQFADASQVSAYARKAINWALGEGLVKGKGKNQLDPAGNATRAEVATILTRYHS